MGRTVDRSEDYVIDMVVEVESRGVDVDAVARGLELPGVEVLRTTGRGMIWLTALVTAQGESEAIREVQDSVLAQLGAQSRVVVAAVVTSAPLGDLYGRLDSVADHELDRMDLIDLVEATMWATEGDARRVRRRDTA
ncbi:MAG TPA: hypothetical protein VF143_07985 [Candidatus Nanopelagicales bacterium]